MIELLKPDVSGNREKKTREMQTVRDNHSDIFSLKTNGPGERNASSFMEKADP